MMSEDPAAMLDDFYRKVNAVIDSLEDEINERRVGRLLGPGYKRDTPENPPT